MVVLSMCGDVLFGHLQGLDMYVGDLGIIFTIDWALDRCAAIKSHYCQESPLAFQFLPASLLPPLPC
jgi:hypothetical protein